MILKKLQDRAPQGFEDVKYFYSNRLVGKRNTLSDEIVNVKYIQKFKNLYNRKEIRRDRAPQR